jgi:hypothetical protein
MVFNLTRQGSRCQTRRFTSGHFGQSLHRKIMKATSERKFDTLPLFLSPFEAERKPAILLSSPGFRLYLITSRQVAAAGDRAGSNLIKVNQTQSNQCAPASRPLPKETYKADLDDPLRKGIQS